MDNRLQGEEDVGFQNELTPEQIQQLLAMVQNMPQDRMPANMGESADLKQMQGMQPKRVPSPFAPTASPSPSASPMPSTQENISPEDMEMLNKILMGQDQTQMPSPTPSPMASPFRNIRGTIDRSR